MHLDLESVPKCVMLSCSIIVFILSQNNVFLLLLFFVIYLSFERSSYHYLFKYRMMFSNRLDVLALPPSKNDSSNKGVLSDSQKYFILLSFVTVLATKDNKWDSVIHFSLSHASIPCFSYRCKCCSKQIHNS